jgi:serine/threonine protein kinase
VPLEAIEPFGVYRQAAVNPLTRLVFGAILHENVQLPASIGKYELIERLGGGTAEVYRSRDASLGRTVAIKILTEEGMADAEARSRFLAEARLIGSLAHENIIGFYDYGEQAGRPFLVMEYFDGESLGAAIRGWRTGDLRNKLLIGRQIASGLAYVHSKGVVHRDVKPDNIWIDSAGKVKIIDFGVAKTEEFSITAAGFTLGTPYYMAPEQVRGEKPSPLADIYSFGVLLFELVTGIRPFEGRTVNEIFDQVLHQALDLEPLKKGGIPDAVSDLIHGCTAKETGARTQDFWIVAGKIDEILRRMPEGGRSRGRWIWIAGAVMLAVVVFVIYIVFRYYR